MSEGMDSLATVIHRLLPLVEQLDQTLTHLSIRPAAQGTMPSPDASSFEVAGAQPSLDVFLSAKSLDEHGRRTVDNVLAEQLYHFLSHRGLCTFFSNISLEQLGVAAYKQAIDDALDRAKILVAVGSSRAHLDSQWVRYEWDSFFNDILSGVKPDGRVFVYAAGVSARQLPRALRQTQCVEHSPGSLDRLYRFIANALGVKDPTYRVRPSRDACERSEVSGEWEGSWRRFSGKTLHRGRLSIHAEGDRLMGRLTVTFEKNGVSTIVEEDLTGVLQGSKLILNGMSFVYVEQGNSTSYLLDHFQLTLDERRQVLEGDFYSRKGPGEARFVRVGDHDRASETITNSIGMRLKLVPAGEFLMGSPDSDPLASDDERPPHRVRISQPFYFGVYPVTQQEFGRVMGTNPSQFMADGRLPVERVSWFEAVAFCNRLSDSEGLMPFYQVDGVNVRVGGGEGYRLPTEAEWEFPCS